MQVIVYRENSRVYTKQTYAHTHTGERSGEWATYVPLLPLMDLAKNAAFRSIYINLQLPLCLNTRMLCAVHSTVCSYTQDTYTANCYSHYSQGAVVWESHDHSLDTSWSATPPPHRCPPLSLIHT